jgi:hypothetical protein
LPQRGKTVAGNRCPIWGSHGPTWGRACPLSGNGCPTWGNACPTGATAAPFGASDCAPTAGVGGARAPRPGLGRVPRRPAAQQPLPLPALRRGLPLFGGAPGGAFHLRAFFGGLRLPLPFCIGEKGTAGLRVGHPQRPAFWPEGDADRPAVQPTVRGQTQRLVHAPGEAETLEAGLQVLAPRIEKEVFLDAKLCVAGLLRRLVLLPGRPGRHLQDEAGGLALTPEQVDVPVLLLRHAPDDEDIGSNGRPLPFS